MSGNSRVIWDKELENLLRDWQDKLWTTKYVNQLFEIITNLSKDELKKWFNIWLYWWWWSGKSSIARALETKIKNECNDKFWIIYFDCWKYSNDDLRRSILLEIWKLYKNSYLMEKIEQVFYFDKSRSEEREEIDLKLLKKICIIGIPLLIIFGIIKLLWKESTILEAICWWSVFFLLIKSIIDLINKGTLIWKIKEIINKIDIPTIWNYNIKDLIPTIKVSQSISEWKIFSWEQFENLLKILIWRDIEWYNQFGDIEEIVKKKGLLKNKKMLFIFDNIDRCESDTVKEILMTVKTFFNQDDCIFLLPIDYDNVCKSYESYDQWDEYLRKIFNLWINLKPPYCTKFSDLIQELIKSNWWQNQGKRDLWLTDNEVNEISYILSSTFADNPRKIKQFLNQLWAEYMIHNKEKSILSILKELIIQVEIPNLYKYLLEDQNILFANEKFEIFAAWKDYLHDWKWKNIEFSEREKTILHKLWWIKERLELLDSEDIKMEKLYHQSPEDFIQIIKKDDLAKQVKPFLLWNIESTRVLSNLEQTELFEKSIYYMAEFWIDNTLFNRIFEEWGEFCSSDVINVISSIDIKILCKFFGIIWEKWIKKLPNNFKITFTERFFTEEPIDNDITEFEKLDENTQNLVISNDAIINYFKKYFKDNEDERNLSEWNYFRFLQKFPKFVNDNFIKNVLKEVDLNSFNFWKVKSINIINLVSLWQHFTEESLEIIYQLEELFFNGYQSLINDYLWNSTNAVNSYLSCSAIIIKYWKGDWKHTKVMTNLVNLYNKYWINEFRDKVMEIFEIDFNRFLAYQWAYADIIINMNDNNKIKKLIEKTHDEWDKRRWLNNNQVENIIDNISREDDTWNNIIQSIRKNESTKNILFNRINWINDDTEKISKIKQLDTLGILTEKDKELFWNELTSKLKTRLESWSIEDMEKVCDFIEDYHNSNIIKYIDYNCVYESLKSFDINIFKPQYKADEFDCYKGKKAKALRYLTNIKKKFGSFNWKNKK